MREGMQSGRYVDNGLLRVGGGVKERYRRVTAVMTAELRD